MRVIARNPEFQLPLLEASLKLCLNNFLNDHILELPQILDGQNPFEFADIESTASFEAQDAREQNTFPEMEDFARWIDSDGNYPQFFVFPHVIRDALVHHQIGAAGEDEVGLYAFFATLHQICRSMLSSAEDEVADEDRMDPEFESMMDNVMTSYLCLSIVANNSWHLNSIYQHHQSTAFDLAIDFYAKMSYQYSVAGLLFENFDSSTDFNTGPMPLFSMVNVWVRRKQANIPFLGTTENRMRQDGSKDLTLGRLYMLYSDWRAFLEDEH